MKLRIIKRTALDNSFFFYIDYGYRSAYFKDQYEWSNAAYLGFDRIVGDNKFSTYEQANEVLENIKAEYNRRTPLRLDLMLEVEA